MQDANSMATALQQIVDDLTERHFPVKTIRRKEDDLPRLDSTAKKMIAKKKAVYKCKGNSPRWITLRNKLDEHLDRRQQAYLARQREKMTSPDAASQFFKNVKAYSAHEKPKDFDVKDLCPGMSDSEAADAVARYFKRISSEFQPLEPRDITATYQRDLLLLSPVQVESMILKSKKTSLRVPGDVFPKILNRCAAALSVPLSYIYNNILSNYVWPTLWKREFVTVIPKKPYPSSFSDLRNISCTKAFSKIFEQHVLK